MRRKIAVLLILMGVLFTTWNGYGWLSERASGREPIGAMDLAQADESGNLESEGLQEPALNSEGEPAKKLEDPPEEEAKLTTQKAGKPEEPKPRDYQEYERGEEIGWLLIPSLDMKYPLYWGTDEDTLTQGVGYHVGDFTTPPDGRRHTVLSGHRDTVFRELGELKEGDKMYVQFEGVQYEYEIKRTWITDAEDRTVIVKKEEPTLTLTTCYPFTFIGAAPDRYIIEAPLVKITKMKS